MSPAPYKNYNNDDYPVTAFVYALHCDVEYGRAVYDRYFANPSDYSLLADYRTAKKRAFPVDALEFFYKKVPNRIRPERPNRYNPTGGEVAELFLRFILPELTYQAPAGETPPAPPINRAFFNPDRPLLSSLGMIFLNGDRSFDPTSKKDVLPVEVIEALKLVRYAPTGRPFMAAEDALVLLPTFADELSLRMEVW